MQELPKNFTPADIETRWYAHWESTGAFRPHRPDAAPYTIVMPPPNVTGSLHIGHALDNTLQDILIRYERLRGKDALWVAGTDHAGIATQMVVERQMAAAQDKRTNYSREDFITKVWDWKRESGGQITQQLRRLGASCDWENERFTMDEGFSKAVRKVFVDMYNEGLIYRDKRLVNWDPGLKTAISDLEVETREINGKFWHFRYPLADGVKTADGKEYIVVATTRPETMLADMAVAVNAKDARYQSLLAAKAHVLLPITGRRIPIIADDHADPELGSGAVKITPGHDFNDFEVGKRAGIAPAVMFNMLDTDGRVVQVADEAIPERFLGLYRFGIAGEATNARKLVVEEIDALGLLDKVEERVIQTPFGDRSGVVIEPWLTDQYYVDAKTLAAPAIEAVRSGAIKIVPENWAKTWFQWLENIQPWCISRQLWWGHQIPVWYGPDGTVYCAESEAHAQAMAGAGVELTRDQDVLDTWFSSALWPFATLGWPEAEKSSPLVGEDLGGGFSENSPTPEGEGVLARHYPNDVLISGFDILFFWDARMAMQGLHQMKQVPWKTLYLHGLVRAADGSKMSKSKGNTVDPLGLIDQYGADALRFFMAAMESQGRDIKMDERRLEGYRNFATKLWNAARFCQANGIGASAHAAAPEAKLAVNRWIIGEVSETVAALDKALADLRFDEAANIIYHFTWDRFCDWYLELIKAVLSPLPLAGGAGGGLARDKPEGKREGNILPHAGHMTHGEVDNAAETRAVAGWVLDQILVMLHPFMPFITEELWHAMSDAGAGATAPRSNDVIHAAWPNVLVAKDTHAKQQIEWLIKMVSDIRSARTELNISPAVKIAAYVEDCAAEGHALCAILSEQLMRMARLDSLTMGTAPAGNALRVASKEMTIVLPLEGIIDLSAERARLTKALELARKEAASLATRLGNPIFAEKAKPEAVAKAREDYAEKTAQSARLQESLARLG
jgi:valyl-tRNA synthetase